jgi:hypothetical protein
MNTRYCGVVPPASRDTVVFIWAGGRFISALDCLNHIFKDLNESNAFRELQELFSMSHDPTCYFDSLDAKMDKLLATVHDCMDTCVPADDGVLGDHQIRALDTILTAQDHLGNAFFGPQTNVMQPVVHLWSIVTQCIAPTCCLRHFATCAGGCSIHGNRTGKIGAHHSAAHIISMDTRVAVNTVFTGNGLEEKPIKMQSYICSSVGLRGAVRDIQDDGVKYLHSHSWTSDTTDDRMLRYLITRFVGGSMLTSLNECDIKHSGLCVRIIKCLTGSNLGSCFHGAKGINKMQYIVQNDDAFWHYNTLARFAEQATLDATEATLQATQADLVAAQAALDAQTERLRQVLIVGQDAIVGREVCRDFDTTCNVSLSADERVACERGGEYYYGISFDFTPAGIDERMTREALIAYLSTEISQCEELIGKCKDTVESNCSELKANLRKCLELKDLLNEPSEQRRALQFEED